MASQASIQSTHPFTCNTCQVAFRSSELQRAHNKTDWHRYNLSRRVTSLPPLSSEVFTEKVLASKANVAATAAKASFEKSCTWCQKTYFSENAYANHLNSQKHKSNEIKGKRSTAEDGASVTGSMTSSAFSLGESMAESDTTGINHDADQKLTEAINGMQQASLNEHSPAPASTSSTTHTEDKASNAASHVEIDPLFHCIFCNYRSPTFQTNIDHMGRHHGMFIPEKEFLVEPEKLIKYLSHKVHTRRRCLRCNKKAQTVTGIQTHMRDRGHCMIAFETDAQLVEIGQFYDFRSTYSDEAVDDEPESDDSTSTAGGGVKLGAPRKSVTTTEDGDAEISGEGEDDEGWETDSDASSVATDEITSIPIDRTHRLATLDKSRHHSHRDPRPHRSADGFHSHAHATPVAVYHDEYELHLPSGRTAGHRSLNKYYRQNLRNYPGVAERMEASQRRLTAGSSDSDGDVDMDRDTNGRGRQLISRAEGGLGMVGVSDVKKAEVRAVEKREQKRGERARNRYQAGNEKRNNFQKHFRDPLLQ